jgi:prepilin-type N-terminal cleavage/methylation domain-containing protein
MKAVRGFTLVELIVVISIIAIITSIATLSWNRMVIKNAIESQIKRVHADMMGIRLEALYSKRPRSVVINGNVFNIFSSAVTTVSPISSRTFKYNFKPTGASTVTFDTSGMANGTQNSFCVDPYNDFTVALDAAVDSIVVSQARINLGKRDEGGSCVTGDIKQK